MTQDRLSPHRRAGREHENNPRHQAAVAYYMGRRTRRAAERAEAQAQLEARRSQVCGRADCKLTRRDHANHDAESTCRHPGHTFVEVDETTAFLDRIQAEAMADPNFLQTDRWNGTWDALTENELRQVCDDPADQEVVRQIQRVLFND